MAALGKPGESNGVTLYVDNTQETPGKADANPAYDANGKATGKAEVTIGINLSKLGKDDGPQLAGVLGHEGSHAADFQSEATKLKGMDVGQVNDFAAKGGIMSPAISEVNAYRVSAYVAAALNPANVISTSFNGNEIWNRRWRAADAPKLREVGIRKVLESPQGSYKYNFSSKAIGLPLPFLNNALDNAHQWTVNGGSIYK